MIRRLSDSSEVINVGYRCLALSVLDRYKKDKEKNETNKLRIKNKMWEYLKKDNLPPRIRMSQLVRLEMELEECFLFDDWESSKDYEFFNSFIRNDIQDNDGIDGELVTAREEYRIGRIS